jgi:hypothetical protein
LTKIVTEKITFTKLASWLWKEFPTGYKQFLEDGLAAKALNPGSLNLQI